MKHLFFLPLAALALFGAGCSTSTAPAQGPDGGVWKSVDRGQTWTQKRALVTGQKVTAAVASFNVVSLTADLQDHNAVYAATAENGLIATLDGGESWRNMNIPGVAQVNAVAVDAKDKCTVYAASANKIYKTMTCGRDWAQIEYEPRTTVSFTQIVSDWYNPSIVFAGNSDGDILRSQDGGTSWEKVTRVDTMEITSMVMDPHDSRVLYAGTWGGGVAKTVDGGTTWKDVGGTFGGIFDARRVRQIVVDPSATSTLYLVCKYGILKTTDGGTTWNPLNLTTPPGSITILSMAVDPKDGKKMVYSGIRTLQTSSDGGVSWTVQKLPTTKNGSALLIDPVNTDTMYLGAKAPVQQ